MSAVRVYCDTSEAEDRVEVAARRAGSNPSLDVLKRPARALGVPVTELLE